MKIEAPFTSTVRRIWMMVLVAVTVISAGVAPALADEYLDALKKAKAEDKAVVLYFYSKYCPYCVAMEKDTLADKEIAGTMKTSLVSLRIDVEKREDLASKYRIRGYPATCLLDPSGKTIFSHAGYLNKRQFKVLLDYAKGKYYKTLGLKEYLKRSSVQLD
jgi:thioredoxin-related protein